MLCIQWVLWLSSKACDRCHRPLELRMMGRMPRQIMHGLADHCPFDPKHHLFKCISIIASLKHTRMPNTVSFPTTVYSPISGEWPATLTKRTLARAVPGLLLAPRDGSTSAQRVRTCDKCAAIETLMFCLLFFAPSEVNKISVLREKPDFLGGPLPMNYKCPQLLENSHPINPVWWVSQMLCSSASFFLHPLKWIKFLFCERSQTFLVAPYPWTTNAQSFWRTPTQ